MSQTPFTQQDILDLVEPHHNVRDNLIMLLTEGGMDTENALWAYVLIKCGVDEEQPPLEILDVLSKSGIISTHFQRKQCFNYAKKMVNVAQSRYYTMKYSKWHHDLTGKYIKFNGFSSAFKSKVETQPEKPTLVWEDKEFSM